MAQAEELDLIDREVGRYLLEHKVVDRAKIQEAVQLAKEKGFGFRRALLEMDLVDLEFLQRFLPQNVADFSAEEIAGVDVSSTHGDLPPAPPGEAGDMPSGAVAVPRPGPKGAPESRLMGWTGGGEGGEGQARPKRLGEYLVDDEVIDQAQLDQALDYARENDVFLGSALISMRMVDEDTLSRYIIRQRQERQRGQKKRKKVRLGDILVQRKVISEADLAQALQVSMEQGLRIGEVLLEKGFCKEADIVLALSEQLMVPVVNLKKNPPDPSVAVMVSRKLVTKHQALPYRKEGKALTVAMVDPLNIMAIDDFKQITLCEILPVIVTESDFKEAVKTFLGGEEDELLEWFAGGEDDDSSEMPNMDEQDQAPIIQLVNKVVSTAQRRSVSDIHFDPAEDGLHIRFRQDGGLKEFLKAPLDYAAAVAARVKVMANLNIAETRLPQDGKFRLKIGGNVVDFRVAVLPLIAGEKIVMRILDQSKARVRLRDLGLTPRAFQWFTDDGIFRPNGIVLVTGPTGSGKTSTLYAGLMAIADPKKNIHTVEDPVEFTLPGVSQVQVHPEYGLDFASVLKSFLRQDPDVILLGEIRDTETARIALKAAMTGHLVLSTLHTNDAISTIDRFLSMGVDRFLVGSAIKVVLAQRLVKKLCLKCRQPDPEGIARLKESGLTDDLVVQSEIEGGWAGVQVFKAKGCDDCENVGYAGRTGIFEVIRFDDDLAQMLVAGASNREMYESCRDKGMITLREAALIRVAQGITGFEEVFRLTVAEPSDSKRRAPTTFLSDEEEDLAEAGGGLAASAELQQIGQLLASLDGLARAGAAGGRGAPAGGGEAAAKILSLFREAWGDGDLSRPAAKLGMERLAHYLESYEAFSNPPRKALRAVDVNRLLQERVLNRLPQLCRKGMLLLEKRIDPKTIQADAQLGAIPTLELDPDLLGMAVEQLALNSLQAMPGGGRLRVITRVAGTKLEVILADGGAALSETAFEAARAPFHSTRPYGLGLGIPVAEKLVQTLGGALELRSVPGKGTLATLRFPLGG